jgi:hypothetical protein
VQKLWRCLQNETYVIISSPVYLLTLCPVWELAENSNFPKDKRLNKIGKAARHRHAALPKNGRGGGLSPPPLSLGFLFFSSF